MNKARFFVPLLKVDEDKRLVFGTVTEEVVDKAGEVFDYGGSKPYFEKWSQSISDATGGKSVGNVRVMHTSKVAGVMKELTFNDDERRIDACAHIVDDGEWAMVKAGGYTGFSIGGRYVSKTERDGHTAFVADPVEISIVDNPCVDTATFRMIKADGLEEDVPFQLWQPTNDQVVSVAEALAKEAGGTWSDFLEPAREALIKAKSSEEGDDEEEEDGETDDGKDGKDNKSGDGEEGDDGKDEKKSKKAEPSGEAGDWVQVWQCKDGETFAAKADAVKHAKELIENDNPLSAAIDGVRDALGKAKKDPKKPYGDVSYADPKNGKYPIDTEAHIRAAWSYINMPKNQKGYTSSQVDSIKSKIIAAWKEKIDKDGPPSADKMIAFEDLAKVSAYFKGLSVQPLAKGMYTLSRVADMLACMSGIANSVIYEEKAEGDVDSDLPQMSHDLLAAMSSFLVEMAQEETAECLTGLQTIGENLIVLDAVSPYGEWATSVVDLVKVDTALLEKAGRRNSAADQDRIQGIHDHSMTLGAKCDSANCEDGDTEKVAKADLVSENKRLQKIIDDALPQLEQLAKDVETLKAQPMPPAPRTHVVGKDEDTLLAVKSAGGAEAIIERYGVDELSKAAIKLAQRKPMPLTQLGR